MSTDSIPATPPPAAPAAAPAAAPTGMTPPDSAPNIEVKKNDSKDVQAAKVNYQATVNSEINQASANSLKVSNDAPKAVQVSGT